MYVFAKGCVHLWMKQPYVNLQNTKWLWSPRDSICALLLHSALYLCVPAVQNRLHIKPNREKPGNLVLFITPN